MLLHKIKNAPMQHTLKLVQDETEIFGIYEDHENELRVL